MKMEIKNIIVEGTPEEIHKLLLLVEEQKKQRDWDFGLLKEIREKQEKAAAEKEEWKRKVDSNGIYKKVGWVEGRQMMPVTAINGVYNQIF